MDINKILFEPLASVHEKDVMDIFNYYAENGFAAYPEQKLPYSFFHKFLEITHSYPAYAIKVEEIIVGFCFLRAYNPFPAFKDTAEISYFISPTFTGNGMGKIALDNSNKKLKAWE